MSRKPSKRKRSKKSSTFCTVDSAVVWNKQTIAVALLTLKKEGLILKPEELWGGRVERANEILSRVLGSPVGTRSLYVAAFHCFGSFRAATQELEFYGRRGDYNQFWTKDLIVSAIQRMHSEGLRLNVGALWKDSKKTRHLLENLTHRPTSPCSLHDAGRRFFNSWDEALRAAGFDPTTIRQRVFWTPDRVNAGIVALYKKKIPLHSGRIYRDETQKTTRVLEAALDSTRTGRSLYGGAIRAFGSWDRALLEADLNPAMLRVRPFRWEAPGMARVLRAIHDAGIKVNTQALRKDKSFKTSSIIFNMTGHRCSGPTFHQLASKKFGSWDAALRAADLTPMDIRLVSLKCPRDKSEIAIFINNIKKNEFQLNYVALLQRSKIIRRLNGSSLDKDVSGLSLLFTSKRVFGSWDDALKAAGLDPNEIRLRGRPHVTSLPFLPIHAEDTKDDKGGRRITRYLGFAPKTPEEERATREVQLGVNDEIQRMDSKQQQLMDRIFETVLRLKNFNGPSELVELVVQDSQGELAKEDVFNVLQGLARNPKLKELYANLN